MCLILGGVFMFIPFIPLGYILLIAGLFLLTSEIPVLGKTLDKIKEKDKKNRVDKVTRKIEKTEQKINRMAKEEKSDT